MACGLTQKAGLHELCEFLLLVFPSIGSRYPPMDDDDDSHRQAKRTISRAVQFDAQIKDLDVSQRLSRRLPNPILFSEQAARTLGQFQSDRVLDQRRTSRAECTYSLFPTNLSYRLKTAEECAAGRPSFEHGYPQTARRTGRLVGHSSASLHDAASHPFTCCQHSSCVRIWSNKSVSSHISLVPT